MLRDTVVPDDIVAIAASWTGKSRRELRPPVTDDD
jgi:hypothetical protein